MPKTETRQAEFKRLLRSVEQNLRTVALGAERRAQALSDYADSWTETRAQIDAGLLPIESMAEPFVAKRGLEQIENVTHVHSGGTDAMHIRQAQDALYELLSFGDPR